MLRMVGEVPQPRSSPSSLSTRRKSLVREVVKVDKELSDVVLQAFDCVAKNGIWTFRWVMMVGIWL